MTRKPELRGRAARLARLFPANRRQAARTPFVLLVVLLLGGGLIGLLVLNSALSEGAFQQDDLQKDTKNLTDEEQALQRDIDSYSAPDALERRARQLGMVPGGDPAFLNPDGTVKGVPSAAPEQSTAEQSAYQDLPVAVRPPESLIGAPDPATATPANGLPTDAASAGGAPAAPLPTEATPLNGAAPDAPQAVSPAAPAAPAQPGAAPADPAAPRPATTTTPGR
ncbi:septum formation initiator family protein [Streptomyces similanensis]|uniref:Septum formation initiator family protein n=1 Tax=Streptomyces similanensis TaxID=1274988 RepID=A0ABP9LGP8_9ACTN